MKLILQTVLRWFARLILWKYRPVVVAITGSVGKTSTKEAIFTVLRQRFSVRASAENYNNEIGVPLTIIGATSGKSNPIRWLWVSVKAIGVFVLPLRYPRVLVLEMGADRPGDISYLTRLAPPDVTVVTTVGPSHLEFFGKTERIAEEKSQLVKALPPSGTAVLNFDDEFVQAMSVKCRGRVLFYGLDQDADLYATDWANTADGISFKVHYLGNVVPIHLPEALGRPNLYAALTGIAVGLVMGMNLVEISHGLTTYQSPPGRLKPLPGVKQTLIIDDTYNSAPASALAALEVLATLPGARKIAVLGDMAELGEFTEEGHRQVGAAVVDFGINILVTIGSKAKFIADQAIHMGFPEERILEFDTADLAKKPIERLLEPGDTILVKGSQVVRGEKIVKEIMAHPENASRLLCRQDSSWLKP